MAVMDVSILAWVFFWLVYRVLPKVSKPPTQVFSIWMNTPWKFDEWILKMRVWIGHVPLKSCDLEYLCWCKGAVQRTIDWELLSKDSRSQFFSKLVWWNAGYKVSAEWSISYIHIQPSTMKGSNMMYGLTLCSNKDQQKLVNLSHLVYHHVTQCHTYHKFGLTLKLSRTIWALGCPNIQRHNTQNLSCAVWC